MASCLKLSLALAPTIATTHTEREPLSRGGAALYQHLNTLISRTLLTGSLCSTALCLECCPCQMSSCCMHAVAHDHGSCEAGNISTSAGTCTQHCVLVHRQWSLGASTDAAGRQGYSFSEPARLCCCSEPEFRTRYGRPDAELMEKFRQRVFQCFNIDAKPRQVSSGLPMSCVGRTAPAEAEDTQGAGWSYTEAHARSCSILVAAGAAHVICFCQVGDPISAILVQRADDEHRHILNSMATKKALLRDFPAVQVK